jgi:hypothetical protein
VSNNTTKANEDHKIQFEMLLEQTESLYREINGEKSLGRHPPLSYLSNPLNSTVHIPLAAMPGDFLSHTVNSEATLE